MSPRLLLLAATFSVVVAAPLSLLYLGGCAPPESGMSDDLVREGDGGGSPNLPAPSSKSDGGGATTDGGGGGGTTDGAPAGPCKVSFAKDILKQIDQAGCTGATCHGSRFGNDPRLETDDAPLTRKALLAHKIGGKPYVKPTSTDPTDSAMHCHLKGECGVKMPPKGGTVPPALIAAVDTWLACGAPQN